MSNQLVCLSDFISVKHGFAFKGDFITTEENENCLITPGNFMIGGGFKSDKFKYFSGDIPQEYILKEDDLIITMTDLSKQGDTLGYSALVPFIKGKKMLHNQRIGLVEFKNDELDKHYLYFLLRSHEYRSYILGGATGSTVKHTSPSKIVSFKFVKPKLSTQKRIATSLLALENKIQLNTQINQTLEQIAQAIFKSWFIDFDPVHAKAEALANGQSHAQAERAAMAAISGKTPEELDRLHTTAPEQYQQLHTLAQAFPSEFDEQGVPMGWEWKPLKYFGAIICGKTPSKSKPEYYGNEIPFIKIPDMHNKIFITKSTDALSVLGGNSQRNKYIPKGSVCVSCIATVGLVSIATQRAQTNQQINSIIPNNMIFSEYLYLALSQPYMKKKMLDLASGGSATLNMNTTTFSNIEVINPSKDVLDGFYNRVNSIFLEICENQNESEILSDVRDLLLPKLLIGEI